MSLVENLLLLYSGVLFINIIISAILWVHDKAPLYRSVFFLWLTCIFSMVIQGKLDQNNLIIIIGFSSTFLINIALSYLLSQITGIKVPLKLFIFLILISYPIAITFNHLQFSFTLIAIPVVLAVSFPAFFTGTKIIFTKWNEISISTKALSIVTFILALHNTDFAFLRLVESFAPLGFSIVIILICCLSFFAPAVVLETMTEKQSTLKELDRLKSLFFANISHEFRTPLTLILGPLEAWRTKAIPGWMKQDLQMMERNSRRLLRLINQLLDISKLESGRMPLQVRPENIVKLLKYLVHSFDSLAERKRITLRFQAPVRSTESYEPALIVYIDRDKFDKILTNLLSNAFKQTPEGGGISVAVSSQIHQNGFNSRTVLVDSELAGDVVEISVSDTGPGIPADQVDKIFDRFHQVDSKQTRGQSSSGIGLALAKELVELHHGAISVETAAGHGTCFVVQLPLGKNHLQPHEIESEAYRKEEFAETSSVVVEALQDAESRSDELVPTGDDEEVGHENATVILIVEDNCDVRTFIREHLDRSYQILEAGDGEQGIKKAQTFIPDLIISDVMMPGIDGYELCRILKTDEKTSHIPIILLTAKASHESKITGLETGADDYMVKPFNEKELRVRIKNLIEQRKKLRERFSREISLQPADIAITSVDERFLQRTMDTVEQSLSDPGLNVESLARQIGLSRVQLHRKLRALTDLSASGFIRCFRLKRAAQLLASKDGNVAEISYKVGFNNPSYFAECFRKQFGQLPSHYTKKQEQ
ncbi:response regulator [candidate division KSB1 bacterium]|nr:response regulator [candidate division KSB1 bacterium]MBL7092468.1 response regulator [candidate division KSB1 bacterium]